MPKKRGISVHSVRFLFDGMRIKMHETPSDLEMDDGDQVEVIPEQLGDIGVFAVPRKTQGFLGFRVFAADHRLHFVAFSFEIFIGGFNGHPWTKLENEKSRIFFPERNATRKRTIVYLKSRNPEVFLGTAAPAPRGCLLVPSYEVRGPSGWTSVALRASRSNRQPASALQTVASLSFRPQIDSTRHTLRPKAQGASKRKNCCLCLNGSYRRRKLFLEVAKSF